jgi:flagellar FliJ protein
MAAPTPLEILIDLASQNADERVKQLGGALSRESDSRKRLTLLVDYRRDYLGTYDRAARAGLTATALINFYHFLQKLDLAIEQQKAIVDEASAQTLTARQDFQDAERKRKSLVTLQDRRVAALRVIEARREQRGHDEISQRMVQYGSGVDAKRK